MVARVTLLLYIYDALGIFWVLEQPINSLMAAHPQLSKYFKKRGVSRCAIRMGEFGVARAMLHTNLLEAGVGLSSEDMFCYAP